MPRPKREGGPEPKKRSRHGCWPCKARKVKCGEEKPQCLNCQRQGEVCDYSIRLNWDGRAKKQGDSATTTPTLGTQITFPDAPTSTSRRPGSGQYTIASESPSSEGLRGDAASSYSREGSATAQGTDPMFSRLSEYGESSLRPSDPHYPLQSPMTAMPPLQMWQEASTSGRSETQQLPGFGMLSQMPHASPDPFLPSPESFGGIIGGTATETESSRMPPPYAMSPSAFPGSVEAAVSPVNAAKRVRMSTSAQSSGRSLSFETGELEEAQRPGSRSLTPILPPLNYPPSGNVPSFMSEESRARWASKPAIPPLSSEREYRRVSVDSLLSGSLDPDDKPLSAAASDRYRSSRGSEFEDQGRHRPQGRSSDTYGFDRGQPDLDIPRNNDAIAISAVSPSEPGSDVDSWLQGFDAIPEFAFGLEKHETVFAKGGYYAHTVPIRIPRFLEPLPTILTQNPINLLYFHHFLNHTARILVPHDCSENPFKTILPKMAVGNSNLLNLLLAYSASHRARLLQHPEPAKRIAHWVQDVFPSLRHAFDDVSLANTQISDANLATAIMLSSLEIISPSTFGISIPWQTHLGVAREIINARYSTPQSISRDDPVAFFLSRWFAYIDVLGSFSGRTNPLPLFSGDFWTRSTSSGDTSDSDEDYLIDCLLGMTPRCLLLLAQIASLARQCDNERISSTTGLADLDWKPSSTVRSLAETLRDEVEDARSHLNRPCPHHHNVMEYSPIRSPSGSDTGAATEGSFSNPVSASISIIDTTTKEWDNLELLATNDSFHLAALIHLHRRILFLPRAHPIVQSLVHAIVSNLYKIRKGGSAEACFLFPMFTAGCEALEEGVRMVILERVLGMEEVGLMQVAAARRLMERVWKESTSRRPVSPEPLEEQVDSPASEESNEKQSGSPSLAEEAAETVGEASEEQPQDPTSVPEETTEAATTTAKEEEEAAEGQDLSAATEAKGKGKRKATESLTPPRERGWEEFLVGGEFFG